MGISFWQIAIIVVVVLVLFGGGKRLRNFGGDLGKSLKDFKQAMKDDGKGEAKIEHQQQNVEETVDKTEKVTKEDEKVS